MKTPVIQRDALPATLPLYTTLTAYLALDRWQAAGWVWGVVGTVFALIWIVCAWRIWNEEEKPLPGYGQQKGKP